MFSITGVVFLLTFSVLFFLSIFRHPFYGVLGYVIIYNISPAGQYWGRPLLEMGLRFNVFMTLAIVLGFLIQHEKIDFKFSLCLQEKFFWLLVLVVWASSFWGLPSFGTPEFHIKLAKIGFFLWLLLRIIDRREKYETFIWCLLLMGFYLGVQALNIDTSRFGRINVGLGGPDFKEGNFLAAHFAMLLPFAGVFFALYRNKIIKFITILNGIFIVNSIVLCRSRGSFLAIMIGVISALYLAPKKFRGGIVILLIVGLIGSFFLLDKGFIQRMGRINTDISDIEEQDASASGRIKAWHAAIAMVGDHPLGIGQGNFSHYVGKYQPDIPGKDTHNTYLRALAELGLPGLSLILLMIWNAFRILRQQKKRIVEHQRHNDLLLHIYAQSISLVIFLSAAMFITEIYIEEFYWILMFPVLIVRIVDRSLSDKEHQINEQPQEVLIRSASTGGCKL